MGRKSKKNKKKKATPATAPVPENLPPPVLTREVNLTPTPIPVPAEDSEADSHSSGRVSPAGSAHSSTSSLLSIGPPPYVYEKTPKKKVGASKSSVAKYVESVTSSMAALHGTTEKKSGASSVSKFVAKEKTRATPKKIGSSIGGPVASKSKQAPLIDLTFDIPVAGPAKGAGISKQPPLIDLTRDIPVAGPSRRSRNVKLPTQAPVAGTSKKSHVAKLSTGKPVTGNSKKEAISDDVSVSGPVVGSYKSQSPILFPDAPSADFPMLSPTADMSTDFSAHGGPFGSFEENLLLSDSSEFGASSAMHALTLEPASGRTGFADVDDISDDLADENFEDMTDEILSTIADSERSFELLMQYELSDFPIISACIQKEEAKKAGTDSGSYGTENKTAASDFIQKSSDVIRLEDLDSLQIELETLRFSMVTRAHILNREQERLRQTANSTRKFVEQHFDPKLFESCSQDSSAASDDSAYSAKFEKIMEHGTKISVEEAFPGPSCPVPGTSESFTTPSKGNSQPNKGRGTLNRRKSAANLGETKNQPNSVPTEDPDQYEPFNLDAIPDSFWKFVDSYCRKITKLDLDHLERFLAEHLGYPEELLYIPPLGKHYTLVNDANGKIDSQQGSPTPGTSKGKATPVNKGTKSRPGPQTPGPSKDKVGPLTQRLVKTLVDERVNYYRNTRARARAAALGAASQVEGAEHVPLLQRPGLVKALGLDGSGSTGNQIPLEQRIRDCLNDYENLFGDADDEKVDDGIDPPNHDPDDEILAEIIRTQAELKRLHELNRRGFDALKAKALMEIEINELNDEVDTVDDRILSMVKVEDLSPTYQVPERYRNGVRHALQDRTNAIRLLNAKQNPPEEESAKAEKPPAEKKPPAGKKPSDPDPKADKGV